MEFIKKNSTTLLFALALVVIMVVGFVFSAHFNQAIAERAELKPLVEAFPTATKFEEATDLQDSFLKETVAGSPVEIVKAYYAYNGEEKVGVIYFALTDAYHEDLTVAFGIRYEDHKIVGYSVPDNNETPMYFNLLIQNEDFREQFVEKDMNVDTFEVDRVSGATPGGKTNATIAPVTTRGIENAMTLVRKQYAQDSNGAFEVPELAVFVSKTQNYETFNFEFTYSVKVDGVDTDLVIVTTPTYTIESVSLPAFDNDGFKTTIRSDIMRNHRFAAWLTAVTEDGDNTIVNASATGYGSTITSVITFDAAGVITAMTTNTDNESYEMGQWSGTSPKDVIPGAIVSANDSEVDAVATATVTSNAIKATARAAIAYMQEVNE